MSRRVAGAPRTRRSALAGVGASLGLCTLLAGCGAGSAPSSASAAPSPGSTTSSGPASSAAATPLPAPARLTASPATGPLVRGTGYRFRVPRGWRDATRTLGRGDGVDRAAGARRAQQGFNSNVNVVVTDGALTADQVGMVASNIRDRIRPTAPSYAVQRPMLVAGDTAGHLAGLRSGATPPYWLEQFVLSHGTHAFVVSFSFSPRVPSAARRSTIDSVLASWVWS